MTWLRKKTIPGFAPRGDEVIGNTRQGQPVTISQEFWRWLSLLGARLQGMGTPAGSISATFDAVEPDGYLFLNGQSVDAALYPNLVPIFGESSGLITLPNYIDHIPMGAGLFVALRGFGGASSVALTAANNGKHNHAVSDPGHLHGAVDRGHAHTLQIDSHTHEVVEVEGEEHVHPITDPGHTHTITDPGHDHGGIVVASALQNNAGTNRFNIQNSRTAFNTTGISIDSATVGFDETDAAESLSLDVSEEEISGVAIKSRADIRVHKAKTGIETLDSGEGEPFSIIPPVFGVNWMVKT